MTQPSPHHRATPDFEEVLRTQGVKLERSSRAIQRIVNHANCGKIIRNNPERKYNKDRPSLDSLEHYSQSQYSLDLGEQKAYTPARALPKPTQFSSVSQPKQNQLNIHLKRDYAQAEKARQFISRMRKQKEYEQGKAVVRRKREEELRKQRERQRLQQREREKDMERGNRYRKMMDNILYHQERIGYRLRKSYNDYQRLSIRSQTQDSQRLCSNRISNRVSRSVMLYNDESRRKESRLVQLPSLSNLRNRLAVVARVVDSLQ